jgi:D-alanyl-D-alanine carboxypeptidase
MQLKMGRFGWKAGLLCVLAAQLVALFPTPVHGGPGSIAVDVQYPPPPLMGKAAVVYDMDSGLTLYSQGADEHLPVASTTKLMTALLVLEYGHLDDMTTVSYTAAAIGESTMYLRAGEQLSLKDLLYGLLLPSGNDAAIALAEAVSGSESAFVAAMNARCRQLGCTGSHFTTPHGLDGYGNYSTAHDLLRVLLADLRFATFRAIVRTQTYDVPATAHNYSHFLTNVHEPLWWYPGVEGAKPGNTADAGFCDALYAVRGGRHIAAVILGMDDRYTDVRDLLDFAFQNFTWHSPAGISASLEALLSPPDDFSQDNPDRFLTGTDGPGKPWRYYVGTGYYVRPPFLQYVAQHPYLDLPTSQATHLGSLQVQQFGKTVMFYNSTTDALASAPA